MEKVFLNDKLVDTDKAAVSVADSGFLYGAGLFETMRCSNGVVFCLEEHLDRLFTSAAALSINNTYEKNYISDAVYQLLKANNLIADARLRLTLTSGSISASDELPKSTLIITATKMTPYPAEYYQKGVLAAISSFRQNAGDPVCGHKTLNYLPRMIALNEARMKMAAEALWFTVDTRLAEGCISNVFLVKNSVIYTPKAETPVLPGIARKAVIKLAGENSIELVEKDLYINDCLKADEIFMSNVIMQVMPVIKLEKHTVGEGKVGQTTKKMIKLFEDFVKENCGADK
jgi:branched-chain amino acid aminotransferase